MLTEQTLNHQSAFIFHQKLFMLGIFITVFQIKWSKNVTTASTIIGFCFQCMYLGIAFQIHAGPFGP